MNNVFTVLTGSLINKQYMVYFLLYKYIIELSYQSVKTFIANQFSFLILSGNTV
jgi:hypothetical protein